ncbi:MAG: phosphopantetheine-containing protein [Desulfuromonas sp.]|nr:MAG: phosphopantetheine-containing protein [Desulfuromonas sp.]
MSREIAINDFIHRLLTEHGYDEKVDRADSLILSGVLDSLAVIHLVVFLEEQFGIDFSDIYFDQTSFDSIEKISEFVKNHQPSSS